MIRTTNINIFKLKNFIQKRNINFEQTAEKVEKKYTKEFTIRITPRIASLLSCAVAFTVRCMWYYRVEDTDVWFYMNRDNFDQSYNDLRYFILFLDAKAKDSFENYESFKINIDK